MSTVNCSCCGKADPAHKTVVCHICKKNYRIACVGLSNTEARMIHTNTTGLSWTCRGCSQLGDDLNSLKATIIGLQDDIKNLKSSIQQLPVSSGSSLIDTEKIVQEVAERERRKTNIIIYNYKESGCRTNAEQVGLDAVAAKGLLDFVGLDDVNVQVSRLGKFSFEDSERCRPLKISFSSESHVVAILKRNAAIRKLDRWSGSHFSRDRTVMQRELYNHVRRELSERLSGGESNLKIKYQKGVPTIIQSEN